MRGGSKEIQEKLSTFKKVIASESPNLMKLRNIYSELSSSESAKEELTFYMASYADESLINNIKGGFQG